MRARRVPFLIVIIFLSLAIGSSTLTRGHDWGDDFASYILQGQSILSGKTDEFVRFVMTYQDTVNIAFASRFDQKPWYTSILGRWEQKKPTKH